MKTSNLEKELSEIFEKVYPVIEKKEKIFLGTELNSGPRDGNGQTNRQTEARLLI